MARIVEKSTNMIQARCCLKSAGRPENGGGGLGGYRTGEWEKGSEKDGYYLMKRQSYSHSFPNQCWKWITCDPQ